MAYRSFKRKRTFRGRRRRRFRNSFRRTSRRRRAKNPYSIFDCKGEVTPIL